MGVRSRMQRFVRYQRVLTRQRHVTFNAPWRIFLILVAALIMYYAWSTLQAKYAVTALPPAVPGTVGDLVFKWFFYGMLLGVVIFAFLFEGEYLLGVWRLASGVEREMEREAERMLGSGGGAGKARRGKA